MIESKGRIWKKIGCYYALTMLLSGIFSAFAIHAGRMDAGNLLYVTGSMWSPAFSAFLINAIFGESIIALPWRWGGAKYAWLAYLIPIAYALPIYLVVWIGGWGGFADPAFVRQIAQTFGWKNLSPGLVLLLFVFITGTLGMVGKTSRALGEEIGWRGFLVPELSKVVGFGGIGLISGLMWSAYHFPILIFADYNAGTPVWFGLTCFTLGVTAESFIFAWLTLHSRSLWPAAILHGSHNLWIQSIFTPLTTDRGSTKYIIDEFGIGLVVTTMMAAVIVWRKRDQLRLPMSTAS